jgi:hypothetical protein
MTMQRLHAIAAVLIVVSLALIAIGVQGPALLWQAGLATFSLAMIVSFATHWARSGKES